ncbi:MAG: hypothetical protein J5482_00935 [Oscillospiraceae bacterium]|nr:hypothetical protein [Oscillospiraceae bacterium]
MYIDTIREIQALEEQLEQEKMRCRQQAKDVLSATEKEGRDFLSSVRQKIREADQSAQQETEELAAQQRKAVLAEAEADCRALRERAAARTDEAAAFIVEKVVGR